jgi:hypothetical protein
VQASEGGIVERETLTEGEVQTEVREGSSWTKDEVEDTDSTDSTDTDSTDTNSDDTDVDADDADPDADTQDPG